MSQSFYFYDLETSGFNPREARIMQFAGQRTDLELRSIGEPHNILIKMTDDVVPEPDAILVTGITPQKTRAEGISETEFLKLFTKEVAVPGTIFTGYNSVRFDDEFMRFLHYRNFYDAYEWQYKDGRSRWDLLDVVRMMRALRPEGIKWPFDPSGKPSNRLEFLTSVNQLDHTAAHDALSDVQAVIALAQLVRKHQPKLFDFLLAMRDKRKTSQLVHNGQPFVYSSGKYDSKWEKTTVVGVIADHPTTKDAVLVFNLRFDPQKYKDLSAAQLADVWRYDPERTEPRLPIKTLKLNRCPAVAPLNVLDADSQTRLSLDTKIIRQHFAKLGDENFAKKVVAAIGILDQKQAAIIADEDDVDSRLYEGFVGSADKLTMQKVQKAQPHELSTDNFSFNDDRLDALLPLYKARNYPKMLNYQERQTWEKFRERKLLGGKTNSRMQRYFNRLSELANKPGLSKNEAFVLEELQLYGQSILPESSY